MKKVLGIVGSKRSAGNCEIMVKEISRQIPEPHHLQLLRLPDFNINYCTGCYRCLIKDKGCVLKDDLAQVLEVIADADALILAVPTYFLSAHSCLKVFLDRGISFYSIAKALWGKSAVGVGVSGIDGKEGSTLLDIERFFATIFARNKQSEIIYGALPGEVMFAEQTRELAAELGQRLFGEEKLKIGLCCPNCNGETFRFLEGNQVRCMLCSNAGTLTVQDDHLVVEIETDTHQLLDSEEGALRHRDWLLGMVASFKERRGQLKKVANDYDDDTLWIKPVRE